MEYLYIIYQVIQVVLLIWLGYCTIFATTLAIAGLFFRQKNTITRSRPMPKIALLIPAYNENEVICNTAVEALKQDYNNYDVVVIADTIDDKVLATLKSLDIIVIEVSFDKSTKSKALNMAMAKLPDDYQLAVILDADNIMGNDVLSILAQKYADGYDAIQGHRTAKNQETGFAILDAISEEMNNSIYCKGNQAVGLPSRLIGSGMAFDYLLLKKLMKKIDAVGGFDKELELELIEARIKVHYVESAYIYDEKVSDSKVFSNQRKRWISSQQVYLKKFFPKALAKLFRGHFDYFFKAAIFIFPPRLLLPMMVLLLYLLALITNNHFFSIVWGIIFMLNVFSYVLAIPSRFLNMQSVYALFSLPKALMVTALTVFKLKGSNKIFIHTPHSAQKKKN